MTTQTWAMAQLTFREAYRSGYIARQLAIASVLAIVPFIMSLVQGPSPVVFAMGLTFAININMFACVARAASVATDDTRNRTLPLLLTRPNGAQAYAWGRALGLAGVYGTLVLAIVVLFGAEAAIHPEVASASKLAYEGRNIVAGMGFVVFASACGLLGRQGKAIAALILVNLGLKGLATFGHVSHAWPLRALGSLAFYLGPIDPPLGAAMAAIRGGPISLADGAWLAVSALDSCAIAIALLAVAAYLFDKRRGRNEADISL